MEYSLEEIDKLRIKAEASVNQTAKLQQLLAQIEATISRKESQKVTEKAQKK